MGFQDSSWNICMSISMLLADKAKLACVAGYIPRWYTRPKTVTHCSTNRLNVDQLRWYAQRRYRYAKPLQEINERVNELWTMRVVKQHRDPLTFR